MDIVLTTQMFVQILEEKNRLEFELLAVFDALGIPPTAGYVGAGMAVADALANHGHGDLARCGAGLAFAGSSYVCERPQGHKGKHQDGIGFEWTPTPEPLSVSGDTKQVDGVAVSEARSQPEQ